MTGHTLALAERVPGQIAQITLDPELRLPNGIERILDKLDFGFNEDSPTAERPLVYHVMSPFEPVSAERIWPRWAQEPSVGLVVTLHDLIPMLYPERYLHNPEARLWYPTRAQMLQSADAVLAISEATARDATRLLGIDPERIFTVYEDCSPLFRPPQQPREQLLTELSTSVPGLRSGYFFYVGGIDFRKNVEGMISGYALLPPEIRRRHQLVISCKILPDEERVLREHAGRQGVGDELLFTGYVPDEVLLHLYQACHVFVFPSLYEGFGLPVVEAMRCGAAVIASDVSSLPELVRDAEARFDPSSPEAICDRMLRTVQDEAFVQRRRAAAAAEADRFSWERVTAETLRGYEFVLRGRRIGSTARRFRLAFFSPMPPQESGVADYSFHLVQELARFCDIDVFVDGDPSGYAKVPSPAVRLLNGRHFHIVRMLSSYDRVLYCIGNSAVHEYIWWTLMYHRGDVLMHDMRLTGFYSWMGQHARVRRDFLTRKLRQMYGDRLPEELRNPELISLSPEQARRFGVFMAAEVLDRAENVYVHSNAARRIALLETQYKHEHVHVVPFGHPDPAPARLVEDRTVGSFGIVDEIKQAPLLIRAMPFLEKLAPGSRLVFAGHMYPDQGARFRRLAAECGVESSIEFTGRVEADEYRRRLHQVAVAVQLRAVSTGETSASVADCLAAGLPTIVSDIGALGEIPRDAVVHVPVEVEPESLAATIAGLLVDDKRRGRLRARALEYASENTFGQAAEAVWSLLSSERVPAPVMLRALPS